MFPFKDRELPTTGFWENVCEADRAATSGRLS